MRRSHTSASPKPPADRVPVERADHGHREIEQREERLVHRVRPLARRAIIAVALERRLEVGAGREARARAGHDQAPHAGVGPGVRAGGGERIEQLGRHAVAVVGAVEGQHAHQAVQVVADRGSRQGHRREPTWIDLRDLQDRCETRTAASAVDTLFQ
jgi:hypothetical protein